MDIILKAKEIIDTNISRECDDTRIYYLIEKMQEESGIRCQDRRSFDRRYFSQVVGCSMSKYISKKRMEYAEKEYKREKPILTRKSKYKQVSGFIYKMEEKYMEEFILIPKVDLEDMEADGFVSGSEMDDIVRIKATSEEEAIKRYLQAKFDYEDPWLIKEIVYQEFLGLVAYGDIEDCDYYNSNADIMVIADEIYKRFFDYDQIPDPDVIYWNRTAREYMNDLFAAFSDDTLKEAYIDCEYFNVIAIRAIPLAQYIKREDIRKKNIIKDITERDIIILNCIAEKVRHQGCKEYIIRPADLMNYGYSEEDALMIINEREWFFRNPAVYYASDSGSLYYTLLHCIRNSDDSPEIIVSPDPIFGELVDAGYDFKDGKNDIAIKIFERHLAEEK